MEGGWIGECDVEGIGWLMRGEEICHLFSDIFHLSFGRNSLFIRQPAQANDK
ncbi:hypothetical protein V7x_01250 [Crateriforma conspicua]|uniref:Uncharacterized protein n=1 Tax=Crateriforma conspicua TaxID=2527996 RepID=A0A5C6FQ99_9PLAN|nr:hypothetical protein V7x_01250 [Crateriforma conspicua]